MFFIKSALIVADNGIVNNGLTAPIANALSAL